MSSPDASPIADIVLPEGALGDQIRWVVGLFTPGGTIPSETEIVAHFTPEFLAAVPAAQLVLTLTELATGSAPLAIKPETLAATGGTPPTRASFALVDANDAGFNVDISVDPETGKIGGLVFSAILPPVASPVADPNSVDTEVSFQSGDDLIYGSFMSPVTFANTPEDVLYPAALIISGSGPTDRNGNNGPYPVETNRNVARTLAASGLSSLRYDKLGSGQTGLATHADGLGIDYQLFLQEAKDAAGFLSTQPHVDPSRLVLAGHSEGALFALTLAQELVTAGTPPAALILLSPLSIRYLDLLSDQVLPQFDQAVVAGQMTPAQAEAGKQEMLQIIETLRTTGTLPSTITFAPLKQLFDPSSVTFLVEIDKIDPAAVAAALPATLPVLVIHGEKDEQVSAAEVEHLLGGFEDAGNDRVDYVSLPDVNHVLKTIEGQPNAAVDYANPALPYSPDVAAAIDTFVRENGLI